MAALVPYFELSPWKMFFFLLLNKSFKSFAVLLSGILFCLIPVFAVATNGFILGIAYLFASRGFGYLKAAKAVLPHDVLEIPAGLGADALLKSGFSSCSSAPAARSTPKGRRVPSFAKASEGILRRWLAIRSSEISVLWLR